VGALPRDALASAARTFGAYTGAASRLRLSSIGGRPSSSTSRDSDAAVRSVNTTVSPVRRLAASTRAGTLTASPITLNSNRRSLPDIPRNDVARVEADPDLELPRGSGADGVGDLERRRERLVRVVGLTPGSPDNRQQPVPDELVDAAAVGVDDGHGPLDQAVDRRHYLPRRRRRR